MENEFSQMTLHELLDTYGYRYFESLELGIETEYIRWQIEQEIEKRISTLQSQVTSLSSQVLELNDDIVYMMKKM